MLNLTSLREQVYRYLRREMHEGRLLPGESIHMEDLSRQLGISRTPLRDAMIHLEAQGFVTIRPRRGVVVNSLSLEDVKYLIQIVGALEASAIESAYERIDETILDRLKDSNARMIAAVQDRDFEAYYHLNFEFHDVFIEHCGNPVLAQTVIPLKQRLYDFPRRAYIQKWELINCGEHQQIIECLEDRDPAGAALIMRDEHWSFSKHEHFIRRFYENVTREIAVEMRHRQSHGRREQARPSKNRK